MIRRSASNGLIRDPGYEFKEIYGCAALELRKEREKLKRSDEGPLHIMHTLD
jgi:hypothetical protein